MLRFIIWSLIFYGIYRLFFPTAKPARPDSYQQASMHRPTPPPRTNGAAPGNDQARRQAADQEGEYIEYEELN